MQDHMNKSRQHHDATSHSHGRDHSEEGYRAHGKHSHGEHGGHISTIRQKFIVCLILMIPVLILSPMMGFDLPFQFSFPGSQWLVLVLASILYFYGGTPFLTGAWQELKNRQPAMMTLISLGISAAYFYSLYAFVNNNFFAGADHLMDFFWELATLIVIMLLGHWIEMRAIAGAGDALQKIAELLPSQASVLQLDGSFTSIPLQELSVGQTVMVKAGEKIPADGIVLEGSTTVDESMVTGESQGISKNLDDKVIGGSQNGSGSILVKVTGTGESGYVAQVMQLVGSAQQEKFKAETTSDKVARLLFFVAAAVGIIALVIWYVITQDFGTSLTRMVTVLVIACPHALGLAIPLVIARSTSLGAKNGLLVRRRQALEVAPQVEIIMMDKTGTLTEGKFRVTQLLSLRDGFSSEYILALMAALEQGSSHPLAASIIKEAKKREIKPLSASHIKNLPGVGLEGELPNGDVIRIVTANYLENEKIDYDKKKYAELLYQGYSISYLLLNEETVGVVAQGDKVRLESKNLIKSLKTQGITPMMLTGDNEASAAKVAHVLGIEDYRAGLLPQDKEATIKGYRNAGKIVIMVGDGVNDAPSLVSANVGVAIGAGTDVAIDSGDVILVRSDPNDILTFLQLAKNTTRKMRQNLWWGTGYNIVAIPLAAGVLAPIGVVLSPAVGAIFMSLSTIIVAFNALALKINTGAAETETEAR